MQIGDFDIACECLKMYFNKTPAPDQFLCRAYICQAQLNAPANSDCVVRIMSIDLKNVMNCSFHDLFI